MTVSLHFDAGAIVVRGLERSESPPLPSACLWDGRDNVYRAPGSAYAPIALALRRRRTPYEDEARQYGELTKGLQIRREPRPFQTEAVNAWQASQRRGVVVLPTGSGKTEAALLAMDAARRDTLVVAPTLDLIAQWRMTLADRFQREIGVIGGGDYDLQPITVTTYDSAHRFMENIGARFGLVIFDECHHLPSEIYSRAAQRCIAPFRLGLTATLERLDGKHAALETLIGPVVYRKSIVDLSGEYLAEYETVRFFVELSDEERKEYDEAEKIYRDFVMNQGIRMSSRDGWSQFILRTSISAEGRRAMEAYQRRRELALAAPSKIDLVEKLLWKHRRDRALLFTERNSAAHALSRRFLAPIITHQTKVSERTSILRDFADGVYNALIASKALNEGVDIPSANVAIVISGSGTTREHVQRLGRILRKQEDKTAVLYELVANDTTEMYASKRRRSHIAYE